MKSHATLKPVAVLMLVGLMAVLPARQGMAETVQDDLAILRSTLHADRTALVAEAMQLSEEEGKAFWPLYREYQVNLDKANDGLVKLVLEFVDLYPDVPEERAAQMLKAYSVFEKNRVDIRMDYLKKFAKTLTTVKALRLAQVENRLDLMIRLQLANTLPVVPVKAEPQAPAASPTQK